MRQLEQQRRQAWEAAARRPNGWQLQHPSGPHNNFPTALTPNGPLAPNTYFGHQYHDWQSMSAPAWMPNYPPQQWAVPAITQTNVMLAPPALYYGSANQNWLQLAPAAATPNPLGGWNVR